MSIDTRTADLFNLDEDDLRMIARGLACLPRPLPVRDVHRVARLRSKIAAALDQAAPTPLASRKAP